MSNIEKKPTSEIYFAKMLANKLVKWDKIYLAQRESHRAQIHDSFNIIF